jgi:hypothetical protein
MKAFLLSIVLLAAVTVVAAVGLNLLPLTSSRDTFTDRSAVRL